MCVHLAGGLALGRTQYGAAQTNFRRGQDLTVPMQPPSPHLPLLWNLLKVHVSRKATHLSRLGVTGYACDTWACFLLSVHLVSTLLPANLGLNFLSSVPEQWHHMGHVRVYTCVCAHVCEIPAPRLCSNYRIRISGAAGGCPLGISTVTRTAHSSADRANLG